MSTNLKTVSFMDAVAQRSDNIDGKDAKLASIAKAGVKIPIARVIGAEVYRAWFSQLSSSLPVTFAVENKHVLKSHCRDLREQLRKMPMPAAVDLDLRRELSALCQQGPVSIRSSAILKDKQGTSTTTTHDTFVGVVGIDAVISRVIDCFVSLWDDQAVKYRAERGVDPAHISMDVVIQRMID